MKKVYLIVYCKTNLQLYIGDSDRDRSKTDLEVENTVE